MSGSQSKNQIRLTVRAADRMTEIFLVDSQFQRLAGSVGQLETWVRPGIYKARFRSGQSQTDQLIEVKAGAGSMLFDGPAVEFASPVPLAQTRNRSHQDAAVKFSRTVNLHQGSGSWLYLFIRNLAESITSPWLGVSLHDIEGNLLAAPNQGECDSGNGFFALNLEVDPGTYRLRVEEAPGEIYEMFVVTAAGWQTQVFAVAEDASLPGVEACRAALSTASVLMVEKGRGFDPADIHARQTELLRLGLMNGREVLTKAAVQDMLKEQSLNPMLAIFAAHFLMRQHPADAVLTTELLKGLGQGQNLIDHPDLQALMLYQDPGVRPAFSDPPTLHSSWQFIAQAVEQRKAIVPPGSLTDHISSGLTKTSLWLIHRLDNQKSEAK